MAAKTTIRVFVWISACIVSLMASAVSFFTVIMLGSFSAGPVTPERLADLRTSANMWLAGVVLFFGFALFAAFRAARSSKWECDSRVRNE